MAVGGVNKPPQPPEGQAPRLALRENLVGVGLAGLAPEPTPRAS